MLAAFLAMALASAMAVTQVGAGATPPLTINPSEGDPGDLIAAQVDPTLVDENCITEVTDVQSAMSDTVLPAWQSFFPSIGWDGSFASVSDYDQAAALLGNLIFQGIASDTGGAAGQLLSNTFVLSFADIATQQPLATSSFDPATGEGQLTVPDDVDPGLYAVAGTCVFPQVTQDTFDASIAAVAAQLESELGPFDSEDWDTLAEVGAQAEPAAETLITPLMAPQEGAGPWTQTYTVVDPLPALDAQTEAFCDVLLEFAGVEDLIGDALAVIPEDDGSLSDEAWASEYDWDSIQATLQEMGETVQALLDEGDETRVGEVAPQWETVTAQIRDLLNALQAVDYDLSTPTGREIAGQLTAGAADAGGEADPEVEAATAALTEFATTVCFPTPPAAAAAPVAAQPSFTG
ncbi:MAG: hypothetical protein U5K30_17500 [Acidimicrobiales bacterium]|nr:hypothetical protein [Acidimicrobiales bacterium]